MLSYITTRLLSSLFILWVISVLVFALMNALPGDPAAGIVGVEATPELIEATKRRLGLDKPLVERYGNWIWSALQGDLGTSLVNEVSINELFSRRVPATMQLGILSLIVVISVAIPVGVVAALRPGSKTEVGASSLMIIGNSIPEFLTGIALIVVLGLELGWFPIFGYVPFWEDPAENMRHMALPVIAVSLTATTLLMRQTRSAMINVLNDDYIRTARAKGLRERVVVVRHGLRNALIPIITVFGFQAGLIFSGAVITETVFAVPGMGRLFVDAVVNQQDFLVVQSVTMFFAIAVVLVNLVVDLTYPLLDPRIRMGAEGGGE
ncbi:MAG: ABC transporter permease [Chloroflexi bacterium]|nr:ABC transporter permease [Chloroflexota bacterium]